MQSIEYRRGSSDHTKPHALLARPFPLPAVDQDQRMTVLVVDDEPHLRELLRCVFEEEGFHVLCAANGEDAWQLWQHRAPAVVVSDVMMPTLDGYGLLRRLQGALGTVRPPVILMSAAPSRTVTLPVPMVAKPFDINELLTLVEDVVSATDRGAAQYRCDGIA